ncbi:hypothetical protein ACMFMG_009162 [Clarireedia jacksonii]
MENESGDENGDDLIGTSASLVILVPGCREATQAQVSMQQHTSFLALGQAPCALHRKCIETQSHERVRPWLASVTNHTLIGAFPPPLFLAIFQPSRPLPFHAGKGRGLRSTMVDDECNHASVLLGAKGK